MIKYLDMFNKLFINLVKVAFEVRIGGDMPARVGEEEVGHVREAGGEPLPEGLQFRVLLILHLQLFPQDIVPTIFTIRLFIRILQNEIAFKKLFDSEKEFQPASPLQGTGASGREPGQSLPEPVCHTL